MTKCYSIIGLYNIAELHDITESRGLFELPIIIISLFAVVITTHLKIVSLVSSSSPSEMISSSARGSCIGFHWVGL